ncbi:MAG: 23S rRNA (pseudouridine(1915)-N(3))-methyltransferase RlmH [Burkholderiales bacterium]
MKLLVVAVGNKMPRWVDEAFAEYATRMPRALRVELVEVRPEPRASGKTVAQLLAAEAGRMERAIPAAFRRVALDERGREFTTAQFARWLDRQRQDGRDTAFLIGGADGLAPETKNGAEFTLRLSGFTLPHGLARVLLAEQLYRAVSILHNHPYHRE